MTAQTVVVAGLDERMRAVAAAFAALPEGAVVVVPGLTPDILERPDDERVEPYFEQRRYYPVPDPRAPKGNRKQRRAAMAKDRKQ